VICQNAEMETLAILLAVLFGWVLSQLALSLQSILSRRRELQNDKRQVYARLLAMSGALSQTAGYIVNWESDQRRTTGKAAITALSELVTQLESGVRASRQLVAEVRLISGPEVAEAASAVNRIAEQTLLTIRFKATKTVWRNEWPALEGRWRDATQEFERQAREDLGTRELTVRRRWPSWLSRRENF
jgi:hypothetical protein